jgi:hypothetical protein
MVSEVELATKVMKPGDLVKRNPRYSWCECGRHSLCWCKKGVFTVVETKAAVCQSGLMVKVQKDGMALDFIDSSYFLPEGS